MAQLGERHGGLRLSGFDVSEAAIAEGSAAWPSLTLRSGTADAPPFDAEFDVVIVSFVLHWIGRAQLARSIAAIDGLLRETGVLVLTDFLPDAPCARAYHHRSDVDLLTYKQDYARCFTALETYAVEEQAIFAYSSGALGPVEDAQDRAVCTVLRRNLTRSKI